MRWLDGIGFCDTNADKIYDFVGSMEETYLNYIIKDGKGVLTKKELDKIQA